MKITAEQPEMFVNSVGTREWRLPNGQRHRENGPAVVYTNGDFEWWLNGQRHRENGPAVQYAGGARAWYLYGQRLRRKDFESRTKTKGKTMKITAAEAREISGPTPAEHVETVYPMIRVAAEKGRRSIRIGTGFWAHEGYKTSEAYKQACRLLEADGYTVKFYYEERQFVDMGTEISW